MKTKKKPTPSVSEYEVAARRLAQTAPERQAYSKLLEREPTTVSIEGLKKAAKDGIVDLYDARKNLHDSTIEQLSAALRLALALSRDIKKLEEFYNHPYWGHKKPNKEKLLLRCLQFAMPPRNDKERKLLSRYAATINWMVLRGYGPDDFGQKLKKEGGRSACASKYTTWRRKLKKVSEDPTDQNARRKREAGRRPMNRADSTSADVSPAAVRLPVRFVRGLRKKVKDRKPPADREYFWARVRHRGERITIIRIAPRKSS